MTVRDVRWLPAVVAFVMMAGLIGGLPALAQADPLASNTPKPAQTYVVNPLSVTTEPDQVAPVGDGSACATVERVVVTGLRDGDRQSRVMAAAAEGQNDFLRRLWGVDDVESVASCAQRDADPVVLGARVQSNFSNLLSLTLFVRHDGAEVVFAAENLRLDTGARLNLTDLFTDLNWLDPAAKSSSLFWFTAAGVTIDPHPDKTVARVIGGGSTRTTPAPAPTAPGATESSGDGRDQTVPRVQSDWRAPALGNAFPDAGQAESALVDITYQDHPDDVAVHDVAASVRNLYVDEAVKPVTCPVGSLYQAMTTDAGAPWSDPHCWLPESTTVAEVDAAYTGGRVAAELGIGQADQWRIGAVNPALSQPTPGDGVGTATVWLVLPPNESPDPVTGTACQVWVLDSATGVGRIENVTYRQAGRAVSDPPSVDRSNATAVAGALATPVPVGATVTVTWPDSTISGPAAVDAAGHWSVPTPAGMISGAGSVVASNGVGDSRAVEIHLDADPPAIPVVVAATKTHVVGTTSKDPQTTVTLTWPDQTVSTAVAVGADGVFDIATAVHMPSGTIIVQAMDSAGNRSSAVDAQLQADDSGAPQIIIANRTHVTGQVDLPVPNDATISLTWPDGTASVSIPVRADGQFGVQTPSEMAAGSIRVRLIDPDVDAVVVGSGYLDADVPEPPVVLAANAHQISGTVAKDGQASTVSVQYVRATGRSTVTVTTAEDGGWTVSTPNDAEAGQLEVVALDAAGNQSEPTWSELDLTVPEPPVIQRGNATAISGVAHAVGVTLTYPTRAGVATVEAAVGSNDSWLIATPADAVAGEVTLTASDRAGNVSEPVTWSLDLMPAPIPTIEIANATQVVGRLDQGADESAQVTVATAQGTTLCQVEASGSRPWTCLRPDAVGDGTTILAWSVDAQGNQSEPGVAVIDTRAPLAPIITDMTEQTIEGTAEPGATVGLRWPDTSAAPPVVTNSAGRWAVTAPTGMLAAGGQIVVTATDPAGNSSPQVVTNVDPVKVDPDPVRSTLTVDTNHVAVVWASCGSQAAADPTTLTATVRALDAAGRPLPRAVVDFSASGGLYTDTNSVVTDSDGVAIMTVRVDPASVDASTRGVIHAAVTIDGRAVDVTGSPFSVTTGVDRLPPETTELTLRATGAVQSVMANGFAAHSILAEWIDGCGQAISGPDVEFSVDGSATLSTESARLDAYGQAWLQIHDVVAETVTIRAHVVGTSPDQDVSTTVVFDPAVPDPAQSSLTAADPLIPIDCAGVGRTRLTTVVKDAGGHRLAGVTVSFEADGPGRVGPSVTTDEQGTAGVDVESTSQGSSTVVANVDNHSGDPLTQLAYPVTVTFTQGCLPSAPAGSTLAFAVSDGTRVADGVGAHTVTIYARDAAGGEVLGLVDRLAVIGDPALQVSPFVDRGDGTYVAQMTSTEAGVHRLRATMKDPDGTMRQIGEGAVSVKFIAAWLASITASTAVVDAAVVADGVDTHTITVRLTARLDGAASAPVAGQASSLSLVPTESSELSDQAGLSATAFKETEPGVYAAEVASTRPGLAQVSAHWSQNTGSTLKSQVIGLRFLRATIADLDSSGAEDPTRRASDPSAGDPSSTSTDPSTPTDRTASLRAGGVMTLTAAGFEPGETVKLTAVVPNPATGESTSHEADRVEIGQASADHQGNVRTSFAIPAVLPAGSATLDLTGGQSGSLALPVTVTSESIVASTGGRAASDGPALVAWLTAAVGAVVLAGATARRCWR
jgi:hypothetical protein